MLVACNAAICFAVRGSRLLNDRDALGEGGCTAEGLNGVCWLLHGVESGGQDKRRVQVAEKKREGTHSMTFALKP